MKLEHHGADNPVTGTPVGLGDPKPERLDTSTRHGVKRGDLHDCSYVNAQSS